jgi:polynucleotide 5'-hydroxyl-kinase GRC3/NOL9
MEIQAPKEWHDVLNVLEKEKGMVILLGATDTGKSALAKFLVTHLCKQGLKVAFVDSDIGQSFLGPPTTIGLSLFERTPDWESSQSQEIFFVGSTTPEGHFPTHLKGVKKMVDKAITSGAEMIVVDTTGFIFGEGGKELKRRKIELISPHFLFALQRSGEIENILELYKDHPLYKIRRLPLSDNVRSRPVEERRNYRAIKFQTYFKESETKKLMMEGIQIEGEAFDSSGFPISKDWALQINGLLIGLKDSNDETLALGVIRNYFDEKKVVRIFTPLRDIQGVKTIQLSSLKVIPLYEDERL